MAGFDLVEEDGSPSPHRICPFCGGRLVIGHYRQAGGPTDRGLTVIHYGRGGKVGADNKTGCTVYDAAPGPEDFLELALPRLIAAQALAAAHDRGRA